MKKGTLKPILSDDLTFPTVYIDPQTLSQTEYIVANSPKEVCYYCFLRVDDEGDIIIYGDVYVPEQEVTGSHFQTTAQGESKMQTKIFVASQQPDKDYSIKECAVHWHSHVKMGTSPSGQDQTEFDAMVEHFTTNAEIPYFVKIIQNKHKNLFVEVADLKRDLRWETDMSVMTMFKEEELKEKIDELNDAVDKADLPMDLIFDVNDKGDVVTVLHDQHSLTTWASTSTKTQNIELAQQERLDDELANNVKDKYVAPMNRGYGYGYGRSGYHANQYNQRTHNKGNKGNKGNNITKISSGQNRALAARGGAGKK